jgi:hypothetical protein
MPLPRCHPRHRINARKAIWAIALIVLCMLAWKVDALDIEELQVDENRGIYYIELTAVIDAPAEYVRRVLTDYVHIHRLHPSITKSDILARPGNGLTRVSTQIVDCTLIFCVTLDRVEDVREVSPLSLHTVIVPSLSNFRSGETDWNIGEMGDRCHITYKTRMEPGFTIFPIIGPFIVREKMRDEMISTLKRLECLARIQEELDWNPQLEAATVDVDTVCSQTCDSATGRCLP